MWLFLAQDPAKKVDTGDVQSWLLTNIIPLGLLAIAVLLLYLGAGRGENAQVMKRLAGIVVALGVIGLAVGGDPKNLGEWIAGLFTK